MPSWTAWNLGKADQGQDLRPVQGGQVPRRLPLPPRVSRCTTQTGRQLLTWPQLYPRPTGRDTGTLRPTVPSSPACSLYWNLKCFFLINVNENPLCCMQNATETGPGWRGPGGPTGRASKGAGGGGARWAGAGPGLPIPLLLLPACRPSWPCCPPGPVLPAWKQPLPP